MLVRAAVPPYPRAATGQGYRRLRGVGGLGTVRTRLRKAGLKLPLGELLAAATGAGSGSKSIALLPLPRDAGWAADRTTHRLAMRRPHALVMVAGGDNAKTHL